MNNYSKDLQRQNYIYIIFKYIYKYRQLYRHELKYKFVHKQTNWVTWEKSNGSHTL